jgi:hypothetical protein
MLAALGLLPEQCGSSCASCGTVLCPICGEEARKLLDLASEGRWVPIEAMLAVRPEMVNYQPDKGERSSAGPRRRSFSLLHWAAHAGDQELLSRLLALPGCQLSIRTREGKSASAVALEAKNFDSAALLHAMEKGLGDAHLSGPAIPPPTPV